jgi:hypothetical protein
MKKHLFLICLTILSFKVLAQYPFSNLKAVQSKKTPVRRQDHKSVIKFGEYQIEVERSNMAVDQSRLIITRAKKEIQRFEENYSVIENMPDSVQILDINCDGKADIKIMLSFPGASPLATLVKRKIYLFSNKNGYFSKISFIDFSSEQERDFNNDGKYEIIAKDLISYKQHNYWKFEVYEFRNSQFVNTSLNYHYPLMFRYLKKPTFKIDQSLRKNDLRKFLSLKPRDFHQQNK